MSELRPDADQTIRLLERVQSGDREAVDELLTTFRPSLRRFVEYRLDPRLRSRLDASDVVQDALAEVARRLSDYLRRQPMPFHLWLRKTAYERLVMQHRKHLRASNRNVTREVMLPEQSSIDLAGHLFAADPSASQEHLRQQRIQQVHAALEQLAEHDREVLRLRYLEEMNYAEIGCILGIEEAAARQRHGRALIRLHKVMSDSGHDDAL